MPYGCGSKPIGSALTQGEEETPETSLSVHSEERFSERTARRQPSASQGETSGESNPASTLILDFQPPEL